MHSTMHREAVFRAHIRRIISDRYWSTYLTWQHNLQVVVRPPHVNDVSASANGITVSADLTEITSIVKGS